MSLECRNSELVIPQQVHLTNPTVLVLAEFSPIFPSRSAVHGIKPFHSFLLHLMFTCTSILNTAGNTKDFLSKSLQNFSYNAPVLTCWRSRAVLLNFLLLAVGSYTQVVFLLNQPIYYNKTSIVKCVTKTNTLDWPLENGFPCGISFFFLFFIRDNTKTCLKYRGNFI